MAKGRKKLDETEKEQKAELKKKEQDDRREYLSALTPEQKKEVLRKEREENFVRIAKKRVNKAIKAISVISTLSSPAYKSSPEQVTKMFQAIQAEVDKVKATFEVQKELNEFQF